MSGMKFPLLLTVFAIHCTFPEPPSGSGGSNIGRAYSDFTAAAPIEFPITRVPFESSSRSHDPPGYTIGLPLA